MFPEKVRYRKFECNNYSIDQTNYNQQNFTKSSANNGKFSDFYKIVFGLLTPVASMCDWNLIGLRAGPRKANEL